MCRVATCRSMSCKFSHLPICGTDGCPAHCLQESGLLGGRKYTARALTEGDHVIHRYVGQFKLVNGLEVYHRSFNVFNLTLWDDIIQEFGELTDQDVLVRHTVPIFHVALSHCQVFHGSQTVSVALWERLSDAQHDMPCKRHHWICQK